MSLLKETNLSNKPSLLSNYDKRTVIIKFITTPHYFLHVTALYRSIKEKTNV